MNRFGPPLRDLVLLAIPFLGCWILLYGYGAYPCNDDFLYARSVQKLADDGRYVVVSLKGDVAPSALWHVVLAAAVARLFGFSYQLLHVVVLVQAWLGCAAVYFASLWAGCGRQRALFVAATLAFCPFYFGHAFTFMTETPAVAWTVIALTAYLCGHQRDSNAWRFAGSLATSLGTWIRQTVLGVLVFPFVSEWRNLSGRPIGQRVLSLLAIVALPLLAAALMEFGIFGPSNAARLSPLRVHQYDIAWLRKLAIDAYGICLLAGFWLTPLTPLLFVRLRQRLAALGRRGSPWALVGALPALALAGAFARSGCRTYLTNATGYFLQNAHFGPVILSDSYEPGRWGALGGVAWPPYVWKILTGISIWSFALVGATAVLSVRRRFELDDRARVYDTNPMRERGVLDNSVELSMRPHSRFGVLCRCCRKLEHGHLDTNSGTFPNCAGVSAGLLLTALLSAFFLLAVLQFTFDRYWMVMLGPLIVWAGMQLGGTAPMPACARFLSVVLLVGCAYMSIAFTHDMAAWNAARWQIVRHWLAEGVQPEEIDGGYEINGWFRSAEDPATPPRPKDAERQSLWWSGHANRFLATAPRPNYEVVVERATWLSWVTGRQHEVLGVREGSL